MPDIIDLPLPAFADDARWQAYCRLGRAYNHELLGTTEWDDSPEDALIQAAAETDYTVHRCLALADGEPVGYGRSLVNHVDEPAADAYEVDACVRRRVLVTDPDDVATPRPAWAYVASDALTAAERIAVVGDSIVYGRDDPDGGWAVTATSAARRCFGVSTAAGDCAPDGAPDQPRTTETSSRTATWKGG